MALDDEDVQRELDADPEWHEMLRRSAWLDQAGSHRYWDAVAGDFALPDGWPPGVTLQSAARATLESIAAIPAAPAGEEAAAPAPTEPDTSWWDALVAGASGETTKQPEKKQEEDPHG